MPYPDQTKAHSVRHGHSIMVPPSLGGSFPADIKYLGPYMINTGSTPPSDHKLKRSLL